MSCHGMGSDIHSHAVGRESDWELWWGQVGFGLSLSTTNGGLEGLESMLVCQVEDWGLEDCRDKLKLVSSQYNDV